MRYPGRTGPAVALALVLLVAPVAEGVLLHPVEPEFVLPLEDDHSPRTMLELLDRTGEALRRRPRGEILRYGSRTCSVGDLRRAVRWLRVKLDRGGVLDELVRKAFDFVEVGEGDVTLTGYYEPVLEARRERTGRFRYPIYRKPRDLLRVRYRREGDGSDSNLVGRTGRDGLEPYFTRREIDGEGVLEGRGLELAWLDDPVSVYFLHVQGSGVLRLGDGTRMRVAFAGSNGRPYTSIGRLLVEQGILGNGKTTAQDIKEWLRSHPDQLEDVLYENERYVFFRRRPDGPVGSSGVRLTPGRSVAADPRWYPPGSLVWIETTMPVLAPDGEYLGTIPANRLVSAHDTGSAIQGPKRLDLFFGTGRVAGLEAGRMAERTTAFLLVPKACR